MPPFLVGPTECSGEESGRISQVFFCRQEVRIRAKLFSGEPWAAFSLRENDFADLELCLPFNSPQLNALVCHCVFSWLFGIWGWCKDTGAVCCASEGLGDVVNRVCDVGVCKAQ